MRDRREKDEGEEKDFFLVIKLTVASTQLNSI